MNVLLAFPFKDNETGIAIKEGLEANKCKVCAVDADTHAQALTQICVNYGGDFDLLLCSRTHELYQSIVSIKKRYPKIKTAIWNTDVRDPLESWGPITYMFEYVDYYFAVGEGQIEELKKINPNTFFLPQAVHTRRYFRMNPTQSMIEDWSCDVGFIGGLDNPRIHEGRIETLSAIEKTGLNLQTFSGIHGEIHNYVVACSKINLCNSAYPNVRNSYSVRNWKILAAGGVAIERDRSGLDVFFNGYVQGYSSPEEAVDICKHIMNNYDEYHKRAQKASVWVRENHNYEHRIREMMEIIND